MVPGAQAEGPGGSKGPPAVATAVLPFPCEALAEALMRHNRLEIELYGNKIPAECQEAWAVRRARERFPKPCPPQALSEATGGRPGGVPEREGLLRVRWHGDSRHAPPAVLRLSFIRSP